MAIITILLSCALGAMAGLIQLVFLGASVGQAFVTYLALSGILATAAIGAGLVMSWLYSAKTRNEPGLQSDVESWHDWHTEESMEADRAMFSERRIVGPQVDGRRWPHRPTHDPDGVQTSITACSARRAGKV